MVKYPVLYIPGTFDFDNGDIVTRLISSLSPNATTDGAHTIYAKPGKISSPFDNACRIFFQLKGGVTDYGADHAKECGHKRFDKDYSAQYPEWSAENPVVVVTHSAGIFTALQLQRLLADNYFKNNTHYSTYRDRHNPTNNTSSSWIVSIWSIQPCFLGSTITRLYYDPPNPTVIMPIYKPGYWLLMSAFFSERISLFQQLMDWRISNYDFDSYSIWDLITVQHPFITSNDNLLYYLTPEGANEFNRNVTTLYEDTLYTGSCMSNTEVGRGGKLYIPAGIDVFNPFWLFSTLFMGYYAYLTVPEWEQYRREEWRDSDGIINWITQIAPMVDGKISVPYVELPDPVNTEYFTPDVEYDKYGLLKKGHWNQRVKNPKLPINHLFLTSDPVASDLFQLYTNLAYASYFGEFMGAKP